MRQLQIKITLQESEPAIWRRFLITDDYRLDRFHQVIQLTMGWWNAHLHEFRIGGRKFGMNIGVEYDWQLVEEETKFYLKNFPFEIGHTIQYLYDFGDNWEHLLEIEAIEEVTKSKLKCMEGEGRCPYEDAGGIHHYQEVIKAQFDPKHPNHRHYLGDSWMEDLPDPTYFDIKSTDKELRKFKKWHAQHPRMKSTPWHQI